jgi:hypothetical protein
VIPAFKHNPNGLPNNTPVTLASFMLKTFHIGTSANATVKSLMNAISDVGVTYDSILQQSSELHRRLHAHTQQTRMKGSKGSKREKPVAKSWSDVLNDDSTAQPVKKPRKRMAI